MSGGRWHSAALTDAGRQRPQNEDALLTRDDVALWAVADGMGDHAAGDVASAMVVEALERPRAEGGFVPWVDAVEDALLEVDAAIRAHARRHHEGRTMGATVVIMLATGSLGACLWAGDSRLYRLRGARLQQISRDHDPVQEQLEAGLLTPAEAAEHPDAGAITRAVGGGPALRPDFLTFDIAAGDRFLLCSDGLYRELTADEIAALLAPGAGVTESAQALMDKALECGARDNVTVVVLERTDA